MVENQCSRSFLPPIPPAPYLIGIGGALVQMGGMESSLMLEKSLGGNPGCLLNSKTLARAPRLSNNYGMWGRGPAFHPNSEALSPAQLPVNCGCCWGLQTVMDSDVGGSWCLVVSALIRSWGMERGQGLKWPLHHQPFKEEASGFRSLS